MIDRVLELTSWISSKSFMKLLLPFCAHRYDSDFYRLHWLEEDNHLGGAVIMDGLQSVLYNENDIIFVKCGFGE